jgi:UPF0755 protein
MNKKIKITIIAMAVCLGALLAYGYVVVYGSHTSNTKKITLLIDHDQTLEEWLASNQAQMLLSHPGRFAQLSQIKKLKTISTGYYIIDAEMPHNTLVNKFRAKLQDPIALRLENMDNMYDLCGRLGAKLKPDSADFASYLLSPATFAKLSTDAYNIMGFIPPNTYNFNYSTTPEEFLDRMLKNYNVYWTEEKKTEAQKIGLTPAEVINLASIVKAETAKNEEAPKIAGLYLNRLRINMPLQSDPTSTYGRKIEHVDRVTSEHTTVKTAFNTYHFVGLPPGPIGFPETVYLNAVLHPEKHDYLFMCAQPKQTGYHDFVKTFSEHQHNAYLYHKWLDAQDIH